MHLFLKRLAPAPIVTSKRIPKRPTIPPDMIAHQIGMEAHQIDMEAHQIWEHTRYDSTPDMIAHQIWDHTRYDSTPDMIAHQI